MAGKALIVFDVDGTLFQTHQATVPAVQRTFQRYGLPIPTPEKVCSFFGKPVADHEAWLASMCPEGMIEEIVEATNQCEIDMIGEEATLYPGAYAVLEQLQAEGYPMAICSNGPEPYVQEFLDAHDVRKFCLAIQARGMRSITKPDMLAIILEAIPNRPVIVVGDREDDIEAAHAHGGFAIAACYGYGSEEELQHADVQATHASEIPGCIDQLLSA